MNDIYNRRNTVFCVGREEDGYPKQLSVQKGMPKKIWYMGRLPDPEKPAVAIVGARRSSTYGNGMAKLFAEYLARAGVQIISGMAWGIDSMAHEGALRAGGDTFAVLGCGVDVCYPAGQRALYECLKEKGGILSEQPPGRPPLAGFFPARNRIISALADLVLVIEAREKSGSLITADFALEQGKDVWAVPGRLGDELSRGCLNLLKQGAGLADRPETILEVLGISKEKAVFHKKDTKILLAKEEDIVYSWIRLQPTGLEELISKTGFPASRVLSILTGLELRGLIREIQKNQYVRTDLKITDG